MVQPDILLPKQMASPLPAIRTIGIADLRIALERGLQDFWALPTHVVFLCAIYPIAGLVLAAAAFNYDLIPLLFPLASGFALIGPVAAIGLYELSRRRAAGLDTSWGHAFDIFHSPSIWPLAALSLLLLALFVIWIAIAKWLYAASFGYQPLTSPIEFARQVMTTAEGHSLIVTGTAIGFVFALLTASISVIAFPLLLDRDVGFGAAVATSLHVVVKNPATMAVWFVIVAAGLVVGMLTAFVGLAIVLPVLGHATWHLYCRAIEPDDSPRPEYRPAPKGIRYAAQFPASLFARERLELSSAQEQVAVSDTKKDGQ